jgi:hypothetical protein
MQEEIVLKRRNKVSVGGRSQMRKAFSPLCTVWSEQVKQFFTKLQGHQSKT